MRRGAVWLWLALGGAATLSLVRFWPGGAGPTPADPASPYFPARAFAHRADPGADLAGWFADALRRMGEPALPDAASADPTLTAYRILALPSFHPPVAVRIERSGDRPARCRRVTLDGEGGYELGQVWTDQRADLDPGDWTRLIQQVQRSGFWDLPRRTDRFGADGAEWVIEGVRDGKYRVVTRWTPEPGGFRDLGRALLDQPVPPSLARSVVALLAILATTIGVLGWIISRLRSWQNSRPGMGPDPGSS